MRVFNPLALSNTAVNPITVYKKHEQEKINMYRSRVIDIEQGSFTPLVYSCLGGASPLSSNMVSQLSYLISLKRSCIQSDATNWVRTRILFSLMRSAILCLRGTRKPKHSSTTDLDFNSTLFNSLMNNSVYYTQGSL